jgi:antitoxin component YwqK of YwqJK toxin-antitoxin module
MNCEGQVDTINQYIILDKYDNLIEVQHHLRHKLHGEVVTYYPNGNLNERKYYLRGNIFGDNELYYDKGNLLKIYQFRVDSLHSTFFREYNKEKKCIASDGRPTGYRLIGTNKKNDTVDIKFLVVDRIFTNLNVEVSTNGIEYKKIKFEDCDYEFPFNKVYRHIQNISMSNEIIIFFKTICNDKYNGEKLLYYDTLTLGKTR